MKFYKNIFLNLILISFVRIESELNETLIKIGVKNKSIKFIETQSIYKIKTNNLLLNITIEKLDNINSININNRTIKIIQKIYNDTNTNIDFNINNNSQINFHSDIYSPIIILIFEKGNNSNYGSFNITIENIKFNKSGINEKSISNYIYCNSIEYLKCGKCEEDKCSLIQCGKEIINLNNYIFKKYNEICIPKNISNKEKHEICLNFNEVNSYKEFNECISNSNYEVSYMSSNIYLIIIWFIIFIFLIIIFYNKYLIAQKKRPFNMPIIFPETLFPNIINDNEQQIIKNNESIYSPYIFGKN